MRSPRSRFEAACRVGAFALLGWLLGASIIPAKGRRLERVSGTEVASRLDAWTRTPSNMAFHATLATTPEPWTVAWLSALRRSGHPVSWSGSPPAVAMSSEPVADPIGGVRVDLAGPASSVVAVRDDASPIDSVRITSLGGTVVTPIAVGTIVGELRGQRFSSRAADSAKTRAVMVIGAAGWEGKFIVSALEERGWPVIARFSVAPKVDITQGAIQTLDTSRVSAVIAIDSTVQSLGPALERFVRSGGGLVLAGPASLSGSVAAIAPGSLSARTRPNVRPTDTVRLGSTGFYPVAALKDDGVALERRREGIAVAARRLGAGRVIQVGYDDSWRWRMAGSSGSEAAHREWWSRVVSAVAYVSPDRIRGGLSFAEAAPVASLVNQLGPPRAQTPDAPGRPVDQRLLTTLIMVLLLLEWTSRRLRGLR